MQMLHQCTWNEVATREGGGLSPSQWLLVGGRPLAANFAHGKVQSVVNLRQHDECEHDECEHDGCEHDECQHGRVGGGTIHRLQWSGQEETGLPVATAGMQEA